MGMRRSYIPSLSAPALQFPEASGPIMHYAGSASKLAVLQSIASLEVRDKEVVAVAEMNNVVTASFVRSSRISYYVFDIGGP